MWPSEWLSDRRIEAPCDDAAFGVPRRAPGAVPAAVDADEDTEDADITAAAAAAADEDAPALRADGNCGWAMFANDDDDA